MSPCIVNRPHGTGDYLFMFFYDEVFIRADGTVNPYPGNSLIIWRPGQGHYYGNTEKLWKHSWIHCDGKIISQCLDQNRLPVDTVIPLPDGSLAERYLLSIHSELTTCTRPEAVIVGNLLQNWMLEIRRAVYSGGEQLVPHRFMQIKHYLETNIDQDIRLERLAQATHLSVSHFCNEFKRYFGIPAVDYLISLRLHQAAFLLHDHNLSVTEVARQVGYKDIYHFSRLFKKHYGMSPSHMRHRSGKITDEDADIRI
ncbi:MAG: AraC family transcriptional regulator [bacterium]|nr:AraC family transcriptional regulator [bacterium]